MTKRDTPSEMPFLDHLEELRWRILKSLVALMVAFAFSFWLTWNHDVITIMVTPIAPFLPTGKLVYTHPMGLFTILMQVSGVLGIVLASPVVGYQIWAFLAPALTGRERKVIVPVLAFAAVLFLGGVALALFVFVPFTLTLMQGIQTTALQPMITAGDYFGFILFISVAFGAVFEMPILVLVLTALGLLTPQLLVRVRRWAMVGSLVLCMVLTPGDAVVGTLVLWVPVYGLYELSIIVSWFVYRARQKREKAADETIGATERA